MIVSLCDNIISSLGFSSKENWEAVKSGRSGVILQSKTFNLPEDFMASIIDKERLNDEFSAISNSKTSYTNFEKAAILSIYGCFAEKYSIDLSSDRVLFVLSSTKGNIDLLEKQPTINDNAIHLWHSAQRISAFFDNRNTPIVVSNACISGGAAQIVALRQLNARRYDYIVVTGAEILSRFIVSGFQSFKALSSQLCRPFDAERCGLNLGEAASTIIYTRNRNTGEQNPSSFSLINGVIRNDATHISAPSRTGEGSFRALKCLLQDINIQNDIAFINAHGTATPYNDAMEANAINRTALDITVNSLKGYFGHTLGAAGVLETIISAYSLRENIVLATKGFERVGEDCPLRVSNESSMSEKRHFIKMLSGFGGCNSALLFKV